MSAAQYTPEEEKRYGLPPLPKVPPLTVEESARRNEVYSERRRAYRAEHPLAPKGDGQ